MKKIDFTQHEKEIIIDACIGESEFKTFKFQRPPNEHNLLSHNIYHLSRSQIEKF